MDDSEGSIDINLWNNDTDEWDTIRVESNSDYNPYEYSSISLFIANDKYIDGGRFEVQLVTDDGWWIDDIRADWTEADPAVSVSPGEGSYSLGELTVGESKTKSFTVENTGDATLSAEPSLTGSDTDQFSITNGQDLSLDPGGEYAFDVEYAPDEAGTHQVDFEIDHNAPNIGNPWTATLSGEANPQLATVNLRVENVEGGSSTVPKSNGVVELYDGNGNFVDDDETTAVDGGAGRATFENLSPSDDYTAQIYHDSEGSALNVTEYWGEKTGIEVSSGETADSSFTRYQPYLNGLDVYDEDGDPVTEAVQTGTPLTVEVTVKNGGAAQNVQPRLVLDDDKDGSNGFIYDKTRPKEVVTTGDTNTFSFSWTPEEPGDVYRTYVINGVVPDGDGGFMSGPTGSGAWGDGPLVTVQSNPELVVDPDEHNFEGVEVSTTAQKDFAVENTGSTELVFTPSIGGEDPGAFAVIGDGSEFSVPPGGSEVVTVEFQPQETDKAYAAELLLDHNGAENVDDDPYPVALQGETPALAITSLQWVDGSGTSITEAAEGDEVLLQVETSGYSEGTILTADIYEDDTSPFNDLNDDERFQRELEIEADGVAEARWTARVENDEEEESEFYFEVEEQSSNNLTVLPGADVRVVGSTLDIAGENETTGSSAPASQPLASAAEKGGSPLGSGSSTGKAVEADAHYFSGGRAVPLEVSTDRFVINAARSASDAEVLPEGTSMARLSAAPKRKGDTRLVKASTEWSTQKIRKTVHSLRKRPGIETASPVYKLGGESLIASGRVIAWFDPGASQRAIQTALDEAGLEIEEQQGWAENLFYLRPTGNQGPLEAANALHRHPNLRYAHPDFAMYSSLSSEAGSTKGVRNGSTDASRAAASSASLPANDEYFLEQWHLREMLVPAAWSTTRGSEDITIAVIDDAVDVNHEDLEENMVAESRWRDTYSEDSDPTPENNTAAHGTAVAGIAAAVDNNTKGVAGVCPNCKILPVRTGIKNWLGGSDDVAEGIVWAAQNGADVLNMSLGFPDGPVDYVRHAILYARDQGRNGSGAVVVSSSGNDAEEPVGYPANYAEVISVGATNNNKTGGRWSNPPDGSQYGENLDVMAPGNEIFTTDAVSVPGYDDDDGYATTSDGKYVKDFNATSSASPSVAGIAGLVLSVNPELSAARVQSIIQNTATDITSNSASEGWDKYTGSGLANAYAAVRAASEGAFANEGQITVVNGGSVDADATAQTSAGWLTLSPTSFSIPAEGQEVIEATIQHDQISGPQTGSIQVTVNQGEDPSSFSVSVDDQSNKAPNFTSPDQLIFEPGAETCHTISASDPEGDDLEYYFSRFFQGTFDDFGFTSADLDSQLGELCMETTEDLTGPVPIFLVATDGHSNGVTTNRVEVGPPDVFENIPPTVEVNEGVSLTEGGSKTITTEELSASDQDSGDGPENLTFDITDGPTQGDILLDGSAVTSFTQADLKNEIVEYRHTASNVADDSFTFSLADDERDGPTDQTFRITIQSDSAPQISIINPKGGESLQIGTTQTVEWTSQNLQGSTFDIKLRRDGDPVATLATSIDGNQGSYDWKISEERTAAAGYTIRVSATSSDVAGESGTFEVTELSSIAGTVYHYSTSQPPLSGAGLQMSGDASRSTSAGEDGSFLFENVEPGEYTLTPSKEVSTANRGITTLDLILTRRDVLGIESLGGPYRRIAADVNASGDVTTADIAQARQVILGLSESLPEGFWRFVPTDHEFSDPTDPWGAPARRSYGSLSQSKEGQNFTAVKRGDVNGSWSAEGSSAAATARSTAKAEQRPIELSVKDQTVSVGDTASVPIQARSPRELAGLQFTIRWAPDRLTFVGGENYGLGGLSARNLGTTQVEQGALTVAWSDPKGRSQKLPSGESVMDLRFRVDKKGDADIRFASGPTPLRAYGGEGLAPMSLAGNAGALRGREAPEDFRLSANYPNPASQTTTFEYALPESKRVTMEVYDLLGQSVATPIEGARQAGRHAVTVELGDLASGMYVVRFQAGSFRSTRKIVVTR